MIEEVDNKKWQVRLQDNPKFHLSVDCVMFGYDQGELSVLLMESDLPDFQGMLSLVGTLLQEDQTLRQAAEKVLYECTSLTDLYLEQVEIFSSIDRHPFDRVLTVAYFSLLIISQHKIQDKLNRKLRWVPMTEICELAFDHKEIIDKCYSVLQKNLREQPIGFNLLPNKFTINQLQGLYETISEVKLDKRNFRRKLNALDILIDLKENQESVAHRPAKLYGFDHDKYNQKKHSGINFDF